MIDLKKLSSQQIKDKIATFKNPNDCIIYEKENDEEFIYATYYKQISIADTSTVVTIKVRKTEVAENNLSYKELANYIFDGLKTAVCWRFEALAVLSQVTLATENNQMQEIAGFDKEISIVLRQLAQHKKFFQCSFGNISQKKIEDKLATWFPQEEIFNSIDVFGSSPAISLLKWVQVTLNKTKAVNDEGILLLNIDNPFIDITNAVCVDHDSSNKEICENAGFKFIEFTFLDKQYLLDLDEYLKLGMEPYLKSEQVNTDDVFKNDAYEVSVLDDFEKETLRLNSELQLLTLDNLSWINLKVLSFPREINNKIHFLQKMIIKEEFAFQGIEEKVDKYSSASIQAKRAEIKFIVENTNQLTRCLIDFYQHKPIDGNDDVKDQSFIELCTYLLKCQKKHIQHLQQAATHYEKKLKHLTVSQQMIVGALSFLGAVLGFIAGATLGFMLGSVIGSAIGGLPGAIIGGVLGGIVLGIITGTTLGITVSANSHLYFFNENKKFPLKQLAHQYSQTVNKQIQCEESLLLSMQPCFK